MSEAVDLAKLHLAADVGRALAAYAQAGRSDERDLSAILKISLAVSRQLHLKLIASRGMSHPDPPFPPLALANRVGSLEGVPDPWRHYHDLGRCAREDILRSLPADWTFRDKRVLDFGCGAGRTLRHFMSEAYEAELWGCDIDDPSIRWMQAELCPPLHVFCSSPEPPLPQPAESFDLIWAVSVFTHLVDTWSMWLTELHRILAPDGLFFATFMGSGMSELIAGEPWDETSYGMTVLRPGQGWDLGGPMVLHAPWWLEEHWGRAFDIVSLQADGFPGTPGQGHGMILMRKRDTEVSPTSLETVNPSDPREATAMAANVRRLLTESVALARDNEDARVELEHCRNELAATEARLRDMTQSYRTLTSSKSWRVTRPARAMAARIRAARDGSSKVT